MDLRPSVTGSSVRVSLEEVIRRWPLVEGTLTASGSHATTETEGLLMAFLSITGLLLLAAFVVAVMAGMNRAPLWVAVVLLVVANLVSFAVGTR